MMTFLMEGRIYVVTPMMCIYWSRREDTFFFDSLYWTMERSTCILISLYWEYYGPASLIGMMRSNRTVRDYGPESLKCFLASAAVKIHGI